MTEELINKITIETLIEFGMDDLTWLYDVNIDKSTDVTSVISSLATVFGVMSMRDVALKHLDDEEV